MKPKVFIVVCFVACLMAAPIWAGVTGAITGTVVDSQTKEPLPGVSVSIAGTTMGAKSDLEGRFIVLNVPVGSYTLVFSSVGYSRVEVSDVRVSADLATFQNREMNQETAETGRVITVTAERPMVIKDRTTTVSIVGREELLAMPTRGFDQIVGLQNSVVRMNSNVDTRQRGAREASSGTAPEINLRGGRRSEVAYYVDGFSQQDPLSGISTANINNNAIKEVSVTSGAFSAEYGHVASGIVNVTTNSGTEEYHGTIELVSDNIATPFGYDSYDQNWYSGDIGGPIPGLERAYFFFSGERRFLRDRAPSINTGTIFEEFGLSKLYNEPQRLPSNYLSGWSYQGKIDIDVTSNLKLTLNGNGSIDKWQEYRHNYNNPDFPQQVRHSPQYDDRNQGLNAKITHTLSPQTFYNLSASYFRTERYRMDGILFDDYAGYFQTIDISLLDHLGDTTVTFSDLEIPHPEWDFYNLFREPDSIYYSDLVNFDGDTLYQIDDSLDALIGVVEGRWFNHLKRKATYWQAKGDITHQAGSYHTLKFGFDFQRHTLRYFENLNANQSQDTADVESRLNRYGYDINGVETDAEDFKNSTKNPINIGIYLQDRFDWRGFIVNAGVRFDYFDYKALRIKEVTSPFDYTGGTDQELDREDLENSEKFTRVSPRLGISFPVSDKTQLYMNYGQFYQRPDLLRLYLSYDFLESRIVRAGSFYPFPSPNLKPEKTIAYEFGLTNQLSDNVVFSVAGYYKDVSDLTQVFKQSPAIPRSYDFYGNTDYGTIKGFDFALMMRRTQNISLNLKYTLSYATGTGSFANSTSNIAWKKDKDSFPKMTAPLDYDQRHSIIGIFDYRNSKGEGPKLGDTYILENFGVNAIIQAASGTPYTPMEVYDPVTSISVDQNPTGSANSANLPWTYVIDMKAEKSFIFGEYRLVPFIWVKNLLNTENITNIYEGTGEANVTGYLESPEGMGKASNETVIDEDTGLTRGEQYAHRHNLLQNNPKNYSNPRMIMVGLRMSF
ncbi:MAG: TonB-dependent receptor [Candidatus Zixiibacteriota bacterium]